MLVSSSLVHSGAPESLKGSPPFAQGIMRLWWHVLRQSSGKWPCLSSQHLDCRLKLINMSAACYRTPEVPYNASAAIRSSECEEMEAGVVGPQIASLVLKLRRPRVEHREFGDHI